MGIFWLNEGWLSCFKNLTKIGLTENVSEIFLFISNFLLSQKNLDVLLKVIENLIPSIFQNLLFDKLKNGTLQILELYLIGAPINTAIIEKIILKLMKIMTKINDKSLLERLMVICDCIVKKYENVMLNVDFINFLKKMKEKMDYKTDLILVQNLLNSNDWLNFSKSQKEIEFRGLMNLGNSKFN